MNQATIILASASPRRKKLLKKLGIPFIVQPADIDEDITCKDAVGLAKILAAQKAQSISQNYANSIIIGSDTVVSKNNHILGKPADASEVNKMLTLLSGTTHQVITGVYFVKTDKAGNTLDKVAFHEITDVEFYNLEDIDISCYTNTSVPYDKAGGYGIQNVWGALFVKAIYGDYFNVMGFPIHRVARELIQFAPECTTNYLTMFTR